MIGSEGVQITKEGSYGLSRVVSELLQNRINIALGRKSI